MIRGLVAPAPLRAVVVVVAAAGAGTGTHSGANARTTPRRGRGDASGGWQRGDPRSVISIPEKKTARGKLLAVFWKRISLYYRGREWRGKKKRRMWV